MYLPTDMYSHSCTNSKACKLFWGEPHILPENNLSLPFDKDYDECNYREFKKYSLEMKEKRDAQRRSIDRLKVIATEFSLDHWMAQQINMDLLKMPKKYPQDSDYSRKTYDEYVHKYHEINQPGYINKDAFYREKAGI